VGWISGGSWLIMGVNAGLGPDAIPSQFSLFILFIARE
jgi:hypothetical protein